MYFLRVFVFFRTENMTHPVYLNTHKNMYNQVKERESEKKVFLEQKKSFICFVCVIICIFLALDLCNPNKKVLNISAKATDIHGNKSDINPTEKVETA